MATFPNITPSYGAQESNSPKSRVVKFGDGYENRITFGLNQNPVEWSLSWNNITEANADTIETFLDARGVDGASFDWTGPGEPSAYKFVCAEWSKTISYAGLADIQATFRQVFEP